MTTTAAAIVTDDELVSLGQCQDCDKLCAIEEVEYDRIYECGECGDRFTRNTNDGPRCPQCNKFAQRVDSKAGSKAKRNNDVPVCPDCETQEMDEVDGYLCRFCSEPFLEDQYEAHLTEQHEPDMEAEAE